MKRYAIFLLSILTSIQFSCNSNSEQTHEEQSTSEEATIIQEEQKHIAKKVMITLPSPLETILLFQEAGSTFDAKLLNDKENLVNYNTNKSKALNLGVYGSDLSYISVFENNQHALTYLGCSKKLADELGISDAFNKETIGRIESNLNNRDSMIAIVNDAYWIIDEYLKLNQMDDLSCLVMVGGWIEGMYLGVSTYNSNKNELFAQRIVDQKLSLDNIIELLDSYKNPNHSDILKSLKEIQTVYTQLETTNNEVVVNSPSDMGVAIIQGGETTTPDPEVLSKITTLINQLRNDIAQ